MITLKWHGDVSNIDNFDNINLTVLENIRHNLTDLEKPSDLYLHTVFLSKSIRGPCVIVWGEVQDDQHFHCEYHAMIECDPPKNEELENV